MSYKWRPNKSQRREFAMAMQNDEFRAEYYAKREAKAAKRRESSRFDYATAGGKYTPTAHQANVASRMLITDLTPEQKDAANFVFSGYSFNEKVHHDHIHIVNEWERGRMN